MVEKATVNMQVSMNVFKKEEKESFLDHRTVCMGR